MSSPTPAPELHIPSPAEIEALWQGYWLPLLTTEGGGVNLPALKAELFDAHFLVNEARKVYRHVTGGLTDELCASADGIIAMADAQLERKLEAVTAKLAAAERRAIDAEARLARILEPTPEDNSP